MKEKTKKKVLKVSLMLVLLIVFVYVTFKTTLVVISNKYLTDIGDYSTNDKYTFTYTEPDERLTFKNITIRNDFKDYNVFNSSNGVIYNLKNEETKSMFYITIEDDKILKNTKIKSYLKKNNINSLYEAERFLYKNRNAKNSIFTSVSDIIAKQELVTLVKLYTTKTPYIIEVNDNSYIYKLGDDIYNYMVFIICLFLCGCSSVSSSRKVYNEYVDTLKGVKEEKMCSLIEVTFKVDEITEDYINYYALINRNGNVMKNIEALLIHDKETINSFPSIGIYDEDVSLINEEDKIGVKLSGYLEVNESTIFKLLLKYVDKDNVKKECYYIYNYQHN